LFRVGIVFRTPHRSAAPVFALDATTEQEPIASERLPACVEFPR